ncbi:hypothetical protein Pedsa_2446 [Pseudopedobacter saltans DSM 12145]|uniref:Outermembrane protein n=1 Tax=Pseudopedobacter saltans (strain ATCC 51119 / DSM 12145 / JCM 21818 / CCUG 39354 / LMG 10337 / NBRC 100064 / NCIMB 13643) TaxID=762903 RepID=F0SES6_PSESL|nr:hypothetical protein [Pseudopedobacter saltans]ADY52992.1 hypothetical protein Pedsa_2446 [Pseudopedobacter saltans DSM 12145]
MNIRKRALVFLMAFIGCKTTFAITLADSTKNKTTSIFNPKNSKDYSNKGRFYVHWGYNFSFYSKSNIHFKGPGYNFTLHKVHAADRPSKLNWDYINPVEITIPQFNFHFGYYIKDNYSISLGWDHMKYVVNTPQKVTITGYIHPEISNPAIQTGAYAGTYDHEEFEIKEDFVTFEHTDGYNFATVSLERYDDIWVAHNKKQYLTMETGFDTGLLIPRTDATLFGVGKNHYWNVAGWGASAKVGAKFFFSKHFFLQGSFKSGFTNLSRIRTTGRKAFDNARQNINFFEHYYVLGFVI